MAQLDSNMARKAMKANKQRADFIAGLVAADLIHAANNPPNIKVALTGALARHPDTVQIAGRNVNRCDDVAARKASRRSILQTHW